MKPTIKQIIAKVRELATKHPSNIYTGPYPGKQNCFYESGGCQDGSVGCIFGQAFAQLDFPIQGSSSIRTLLDRHSINYHHDEVSWCSLFQLSQDKGHTWSKALEVADEFYPSIKM